MHKIHVAAISMSKPNCVGIHHVQRTSIIPAHFLCAKLLLQMKNSIKIIPVAFHWNKRFQFFDSKSYNQLMMELLNTSKAKEKIESIFGSSPIAEGDSESSQQLISSPQSRFFRTNIGHGCVPVHNYPHTTTHSTNKSWQCSIWWLRRIGSVVPWLQIEMHAILLFSINSIFGHGTCAHEMIKQYCLAVHCSCRYSCECDAIRIGTRALEKWNLNALCCCSVHKTETRLLLHRPAPQLLLQQSDTVQPRLERNGKRRKMSEDRTQKAKMKKTTNRCDIESTSTWI